MNTTVGKTVQQRRRAKGMTQEQLAQLVGVSSAAVSKWETASALPDVALLCPLARALDCTLDELLDFKPQLTAEEVNTMSKTAARLFQQGQGQKARDFCEARLKEYPNDLYLAFCCGGLYTQYLSVNEDEDQARRQLERAVQLMERARGLENEEQHRSALLTLAGLYTMQERLEDALNTLDQLPGCNQDAQSMRASILLKKGDLETAEALENANLASHLHNAQLSLLGLATIAHKKGQDEKVLALLDQLDQLDAMGERFQLTAGGMSRMAAIRRMELYCTRQQWDEAVAQAQRFVDLTLEAEEALCDSTCEECRPRMSRAFWLQNALQLLAGETLPPQVTESEGYRQAKERLQQAFQQARQQETCGKA